MSWFQNKEKRLWKAAKNGNLNQVKECVRQNVNVNARDNGYTALYVASQNGHLEVVQYLIRDGKADVEAKSTNGFTALYVASQLGRLDVVQYLVRDGKAHVECLVRDGKANVKAKQKDGFTALHIASQHGHLEVVQFLVRDGKVDVDEKENEDGWSVLHAASYGGHLKIVHFFLIVCKANFDALDNEGKTALDLARQKGKEDVVRFLSDYDQSIKSSPPSNNNYAADLSFDLSLSQKVPDAGISENSAVRSEKDIVASRNELQRMLNDPMPEPTPWSIKYLEECTDTFTSKVLGEGAFGKVCFGCDKVLGFPIAVKRVPLKVPDPDILSTIIDSFRREVLVLKRFRHPNIVALYGFNITLNEKCQFLVYEYLVNGALSGFLTEDLGRTRLPAHVRIAIMFQVPRAVHFLHTGGCDNFKIFHRDIKSGNICLTQDYTAKLIDCGMSKFVPEDQNVSHGKSVTPTILKSSGTSVFGTPGYICPNYLRRSGRVSFTAACDVYSMGVVFAELIVGCLQDGQSTRNGQDFDDYHNRYIVDEYGEKVDDGLAKLISDGDPVAEWETPILELLSTLTCQCLAASPMRRPSTQILIQKLGEISKTDFQGPTTSIGQVDPPEESIPNVSLSLSNEIMSVTACVLCHESVVGSVPCSNKHATCIPCTEQRVQAYIGRSGDDVCCGIVGCNAPFQDEFLYGKISTFTFREYVRERERQKGIEDIFKLLSKNHEQVMMSLKEIKSVAQRSLKGLAYLATESVKKCPTLVWMVPAEPVVGRSARDWVQWAKIKTSHRRYHVYFPKMEVEVPRSWMVQAAPVLRLSLFAIKAALSALGPLPFPVPDIVPKEQIAMTEHFVNSLLDDTTKKMLVAFESSCTSGIDLPQSESSHLMTLTGPAYEGIVEKATKLKRTHWKQHMVPVMNPHGSLIRVKKEYQDLY